MLQGGQFQTVAIPKRLQLVAPTGYRFNDFNIDSQLINCLAEKDPYDDEYWIQKRPCFGNVVITPASNGAIPARGLYAFHLGGFNNDVFLVINNERLSRIDTGLAASTLIGNIAGNQANYAFETVRSSPNRIAVFNDTSQAYYTTTAAVVDMNGLANFPTNIVRGWAYLDGTLYVMKVTNEIYGSANLDDPTVWNLTNVIIARNGSDPSVALSKHKEYVMALKRDSTEFFYNAGNPTGSPLAALRGSKIPYGCANAYTEQKIDEENFWVSRNEGGNFQVIRLTNLRPSIISTPTVERILRNFSGIGTIGTALTARSFQLKLGGHRYYGLSLPVEVYNYITGATTSTTVTLVYDLDQALWYRWTSASSNAAWEMAGNSVLASDRRVAMQNYSTGNVHVVSEDYIQNSDAGTAPPVEIYTPDHDFGTQRNKQLAAMFFRGNIISGSELQLRYSDDDFVTWSNWRSLNLGIKHPNLTDCGSFYRRAWNLRHQSPTPFRIKTTDLQLDMGTL